MTKRRNLLKLLIGTKITIASGTTSASTSSPWLSSVINLLLDDTFYLPVGNYISVIPNDACYDSADSGVVVRVVRLGPRKFSISDMDLGYFFGDYIVPGEFEVDKDDTTLVLKGSPDAPFGISWVGAGNFYLNGGIHNLGRLEFLCYYDTTYAGPAATESIWFDKLPENP